MLAVIGGSGMAQLPCLEISHRQIIRTPYGEPSGPLTFGKINNHEIVFLARHGHGHIIPPHAVNYRANIWALNSLKPKHVIAVAAVGGIHADFKPGMLVIPDQIIDYTYGRKFTFFEGTEQPITYTDFTYPYCQITRDYILEAAKQANEAVIDGGVYAATQGPRLETAAEINRLERDGADMVGMTGMPEVALAKELGLCYATIAVVANHAAGRGSSVLAIPLAEVYAILEKAMVNVRNILQQAAKYNGN
ncbi:methylthioadenosine phosphorylase [Nitrosomonas cryotolerans]|uniref:Probable 6-oxopurine nucleoside phosphorylase n=1 Tax=Nitrosomonas cryotolerans ATCC 49181 TaxID=1131553 RepID=A0A1N6I377_9PROT|nr:S-methyl-5'-thioinosine phosphorylase [Nitrosomonas cryotolerans]SFP59249.1 methylthioadenosine phosphorylase [Nitrosomonas cryotolerans]SIO26484.1 methylthioadenosine phosphorylase [Nitrosomonas cryotolerans ATCC 49181]